MRSKTAKLGGASAIGANSIAFGLRNGFRDANVYRTYNDITMTIMMMGEGTFTMQDWDDIIHELQQFWWPDDIEEE